MEEFTRAQQLMQQTERTARLLRFRLVQLSHTFDQLQAAARELASLGPARRSP